MYVDPGELAFNAGTPTSLLNGQYSRSVSLKYPMGPEYNILNAITSPMPFCHKYQILPGFSWITIPPRFNTQAIQWHLEEISCQIAPGADSVLILDQARWHTTKKLTVPESIKLLHLPPRSPELNPVESICEFMRDNWLSNRGFQSYEQIVALCCETWNRLIDQSWTIVSIGHRK